jgi:hypothetical protein
MKVCGNCRKFLAEDAVFCPTCGTRAIELKEPQDVRTVQNGQTAQSAQTTQNAQSPQVGYSGTEKEPDRSPILPQYRTEATEELSAGRGLAPLPQTGTGKAVGGGYAEAGQAPQNAASAPQSEFDGKLLELIAVRILQYLIISFTLGIATPWAVCFYQRWETKHTIIDGKRLKFNGQGFDLFVKFIIWYLLTIVTLGIYGFWLSIKMKKWIVEHTEGLGDGESRFDGGLLGLIKTNIVVAAIVFGGALGALSLGGLAGAALSGKRQIHLLIQ